MSGAYSSEITQLLHDWRGGDQLALQRLTPVVYEELHRMAKRYMARERDGHTLQTTALINEVYLRLVKAKEVEWRDRCEKEQGRGIAFLRRHDGGGNGGGFADFGRNRDAGLEHGSSMAAAGTRHRRAPWRL